MQTIEKIDLEAPDSAPSHLKNLKNWLAENKKVSLPLGGLAILFIIALVPWSRYHTAGTIIKKDYRLAVNDTTANFPVSGAAVYVDQSKFVTDADGTALLRHLRAGHHSVKIEKANYHSQQLDIIVPILSQKKPSTFNLTATGRQVKLTIKNLITEQAIAGAEVTVDGIKSTTDDSGGTLVVVAPGEPTRQAKASAKNYNDQTGQIEISDKQIMENTLKLTPAGEVYFLSKLSGRIDLVKANLDGTQRQTVLAGTGEEDDRGTVLLASNDWHYLALLANRDGAPKVYIINTSTDGLITVDQTNADFTFAGWADHYLVYSVSKHNYNSWQSNAFSIKSYNAGTGKLLTLANTSASGSSLADAQYENFWDVKLFNGDVIFSRTWYQYPGYLKVTGKQNSLAGIQPGGSNSRQIKQVDAETSYISDLRVNKPKQLQFSISSNDGASTTYYSMDANANIKQLDQPSTDEPVVYLPSPSASNTLWYEPRDGKNSLFIGDSSGDNSKAVATLSGFIPYGWYTDQYLLLSKGGSQLYVMPRTGIKDDSQAIKITDYHKPAQDFYGYGGI